jgi:2-oxoisovalerate dehydrogenase E2 component (dihydrolipoyl transacylase)
MTENGSKGTAVPVPHLAESLVSATVGKWLKQPGEAVTQYEVICELITDKVNVEMPSPIEGILVSIAVPEGETANVGEALCYIAEPSSAGGSPAGQGGAQPAAAEAKAAVSAVGEAAVGGVAAASVVASAGAAAGAAGGEMYGRFSPAVLKLAAERGVALASVPGTGIGGRVTRKDVLAYAERAERAGAPAPGAAAAANGAASVAAAAPAPVPQPYVTAPLAQQAPAGPPRTSGLHLSGDIATPFIGAAAGESSRGESLIDVTPVRSTIATRMRQSVSEIPHAWTMVEVDVTNLVQLRTRIKDEFMRKEGVNLTYLAFVLKAVVNAIKDYPIMNSVWAVDKIIVKKDINISLAVGTEEMVITPVIKKADQKNIAGLAQEIDALTKKARSGKLGLDDLSGGTFTVNNTGSFGSLLSYPIINYPQAAILTFESIVKRPVVINDMIAVRSMVNMCLSLDHRILDGVICGRFLQRIKENLESYGPQTTVY